MQYNNLHVLPTQFNIPWAKKIIPFTYLTGQNRGLSGRAKIYLACDGVFVVIFFIIIYMHTETIIIRICVCGIWNNQGRVKCYQEIITFSLTITGYCSLTICLLTAKLPVNLFSSSFTLAYPEKPWHWAKVSTCKLCMFYD